MQKINKVPKGASRLAMCALALTLSFTWGAANAEGKRATINAETLTTNPPYESKDQATDKLVGFDIDLVEALASKMGAKVNWIESSWQQINSHSSIKTKRADISVAGLADTPQRRTLVNLLGHAVEAAVIVTSRGNAARFPTTESLCGKRLAMTRSSALWLASLEKWNVEHCTGAGRPAAIMVGVDSSAQARLEILQGRVDAAVSNMGQVIHENSIEKNRYVIIGELVRQQFAIAFSMEDPEFGRSLKKALAELLADGSYQKILRKWNLPESTAPKQAMINGEP